MFLEKFEQEIKAIRYFLLSYFFAKRNYRNDVLCSQVFKKVGSIGWQWAYYDKNTEEKPVEIEMCHFLLDRAQ